MNLLINLLLCGIIQVTIVAVAGLTASGICRRWLRMPGIAPVAAALSSVVLLSLLVFSPWPSWLTDLSAVSQTAGDSAAVSSRADEHSEAADVRETSASQGFGIRDALSAGWTSLLSTPGDVTEQSDSRAAATSVGTSTSRTDWRWLVMWVLIGGVAVGLTRLVGGLWAVNGFVSSSRPVTSAKLRELADVLCAELGCTETVSLRESPRLATAATVGWRKPVILISNTWKTWTRQQLRSVLAHEIAHIRRGDFTTALLAQIGLVLHFYHPLVHSLVRRLRLEQELAADALAASIVGGSKSYLNAIGELALSQSKESVGWPAQAFLPTRRTFLRRIEMLRDLKTLTGPASRKLASSAVLAVAVVTLLASGIRSPQGLLSSNATAADPVAAVGAGSGLAAVPVQSASLTPQYVPADAFVVFVARPAAIVTHLRELAEKARAAGSDTAGQDEVLGIFGECEQVTAVFTDPGNQLSTPDQQSGAAMTFLTKSARDAAMDFFSGSKPHTPATILSHGYEVHGRDARYMPDDLTLIMGNEQVVQKMILTGSKSLSALTDGAAWDDAVTHTAAIAVDATVVRRLASMEAPGNPMVGLFSPMWTAVNTHTAGLQFGDQVDLKITSDCTSEVEAKRVEATFTAMIAMATNMAAGHANSPGAQPASKVMAETAKAALAGHKLSRDGSVVTVALSGDLVAIAEPLFTAVNGARGAAQRSQQSNNHKQILLALHNYHDVYGKFPRAITYDEATGHARSWRVEILPFIEQDALYRKYRMNEPWDSPANKEVLAQMPRVFRHPSVPETSTDTCVLAAYGKGLAFEVDAKAGAGIADFADGTSNTIMIVEGEAAIPWTKPEDVLIDLSRNELPKFGFDAAGFSAGFADGSVKFISSTMEIANLKALFTRAGGEPINFDIPPAPNAAPARKPKDLPRGAGAK